MEHYPHLGDVRAVGADNSDRRLLQQATRRERYAGFFHTLIFWGIIVLTLATIVVFIDEDLSIRIMRGQFYLWFQSLAVDLFGLATMVGVGLAALRRLFLKPKQLVYTKEAALVLMMSGDASFNEMFFTNLRVPVANVLGKVNEGWGVALTALGNERVSISTGRYMVLKRELDQLLERSRETRRNGVPLTKDPLVRQRLAQAHVELEVFRLNTLRAVTAPFKGGAPGPEGSLLKICWSETNQRVVHCALEVLGLPAQLWDCDEGRWAFNYLRARGNSIEGGTSEIQRNIVAQRVLGLPRSY